MLICFWASWCLPCLAELKELAKREKEIRAKGIEVVALAVDGLGKDDSAPTAALARIKKTNFPFTSGRATAELLRIVEAYHHYQIVLSKQLPIPMSILIDEKGRLSVIYLGRLSVNDLLKDAASSTKSLKERFVRAAAFPGRTMNRRPATQALEQAEITLRFRMGYLHHDAGRYADAELQYRRLLRLKPSLGLVHGNLALVLMEKNQVEQAIRHYQEAIRHSPKEAWLHYNLAVIYLQREELDKAEQGYRNAIKIKPDYVEAHVNMGLVLSLKRRYPEAATHFRKALKINPNFSQAREGLRLIEPFLSSKD